MCCGVCVFVLDDSFVHKVVGLSDPLFGKGVLVVFLLCYSLVFNPEFVWSKVRAYLRKVEARR